MQALSIENTPPARRAGASSGQILVQRLRSLCAMTVAALIFWYFGWRVAGPTDPLGAVSLLMIPEGQGVIIMAELLGLCIVVSGLGVAICGAGSARRGPLAVAVGLATLALRGGQMDRLVQFRLTASTTAEEPLVPFPVWALISETWLWLALIGVGLVVGRWVEGWFTSSEENPPAAPHPTGEGDLRHNFGALAVSVLLAWLILNYTIGSGAIDLAKGQIYFGVLTAFLVASLIAHWFFQPAAKLWTLLCIALVATAGYVQAAPDAAVLNQAARLGAYVTLQPLARPLPIEYAALGAIGVLLEADAMAGVAAMFGLRPSQAAVSHK